MSEHPFDLPDPVEGPSGEDVTRVPAYGSVASRPTVARPRRGATAPKSHMVMAAWSLLGTWPLALVAMSFASSVDKKWASGDRAAAHKASARARQWAIASWVLAVVLFVSLAALS